MQITNSVVCGASKGCIYKQIKPPLVGEHAFPPTGFVCKETHVTIDSLHTGAVSAIKWGGTVSDGFQIAQGVRKGGVLSADLYKVYVDPVLHTVSDAGIGARVGNIACAVPTCEDDVIVASKDSFQDNYMKGSEIATIK